VAKTICGTLINGMTPIGEKRKMGRRGLKLKLVGEKNVTKVVQKSKEKTTENKNTKKSAAIQK
jgi:hypothetical protein